MTVQEVMNILDGKLLTNGSHLQNQVASAYSSDMMSDVLTFVKDRSVLLTGLVNPQVVRTAEMMDTRCIIFVRGKIPDADIVRLAQERGIELLTTTHRMFTACGLLYSYGLRGEAKQHG